MCKIGRNKICQSFGYLKGKGRRANLKPQPSYQPDNLEGMGNV